MNGKNPKPKSNAPARAQSSKRDTVANNLTGRVKHDDRGNAVWEWAVAKLDNSTLSLAEDGPMPTALVKENPLGTVTGYSPYDSGVLGKKASPRKKKNLRKLSEWLKLKQQFETKKSGE